MEDAHYFEVDAKLAGLGSTVKMDGVPLKNVRSFKVSTGCDEITTITLEIVGTARVHGQGQVWIVDADKIAAEEASAAVAAAELAALDAEEAEFEAEAKAKAEDESKTP